MTPIVNKHFPDRMKTDGCNDNSAMVFVSDYFLPDRFATAVSMIEAVFDTLLEMPDHDCMAVLSIINEKTDEFIRGRNVR
jgi:hypothetical protein